MVQGDATRNIYGYVGDIKVGYYYTKPGYENWNAKGTGSISTFLFNNRFQILGESPGSDYREDVGHYIGINFSSAYITPTASENRPINISVRYFVRSRP